MTVFCGIDVFFRLRMTLSDMTASEAPKEDAPLQDNKTETMTYGQATTY